MLQDGFIKKNKMIIYVDIDETICHYEDKKRDYKLAKPITKNINKFNKLFDDGHEIIYWTARGSTTGIDWYDLTDSQLKKWGVKYKQFKVGKPYYDLFICDKAINSENFFDLEANK